MKLKSKYLRRLLKVVIKRVVYRKLGKNELSAGQRPPCPDKRRLAEKIMISLLILYAYTYINTFSHRRKSLKFSLAFCRGQGTEKNSGLKSLGPPTSAGYRSQVIIYIGNAVKCETLKSEHLEKFSAFRTGQVVQVEAPKVSLMSVLTTVTTHLISIHLLCII